MYHGMYYDSKILKKLVKNKSFLKVLKKDLQDSLTQEEFQELIDNLKGKIDTDIMGAFDDWYNDALSNEADKDVLVIGWDSSNWGPGGSGFVSFRLFFDTLVFCASSDYEDDHVELFDKEDFDPWCPDSLIAEYINLTSDIYNDEELIGFATSFGIGDDQKLTVNGKEVVFDSDGNYTFL